MIFVHIGAGAGDQDPFSNFRDGFSEYVKNHESKIKKIFVIEPNPKNIEKLKKTWENYNDTEFLNFAIVPNNFENEEIKLFYSEEDSLHCQYLSNNIDHIKHYFPNSKINYLLAKTLKIETFLNKFFKNQTIESFSTDIEGADSDIIMDIDLVKYKINNISFEYLHLSKDQKKKLIDKLINNGYSYNGVGIDHNNIDLLFTKKNQNGMI
tara:strand:- start:291 stop:917 length:627 start_codon:yes stop_codon:yes gene_type:complete